MNTKVEGKLVDTDLMMSLLVMYTSDLSSQILAQEYLWCVSFLCVVTGSRSKSVDLEDVKFHQCVRLSRFENDRTISFVPPDGDFELMSYRLTTQVKPLIWIESSIQRHSRSRIEYVIKVGSN